MKTIKFIDAVSGTDPDSGTSVSFVVGQVIELTDKTAKMYIKAKVAKLAAKKDKEKQHIDDQDVEIKQLDYALVGCNEQLRDVIAKNTELVTAVGELTESVSVIAAARDKLSVENATLTDEIAELLNEPVDDDDNSSDATTGEGDKSSDATTGDGATGDGDKSSDVATGDATTGDGDKSSDVATGDGDAGDVKPAVVVGADGKRKKAMPRKGGVAAE
ncbi:MAG: hypothetical protein COC24_018050 [Alphaproteobacteria bacterium]|nr:hypothetical protein [Alphaproteobacteria bacterium]